MINFLIEKNAVNTNDETIHDLRRNGDRRRSHRQNETSDSTGHLLEELPATAEMAASVSQHRKIQIFCMAATIGCWSSDPVRYTIRTRSQYAHRKPLADRIKSRQSGDAGVFEKPRTVVGWKGLINDPYLTAASKSIKGFILPAGCYATWRRWIYRPALSS